jgi:energy-coupling factor transporter ATP-binding protein EcfA2
MSVIEEIPKWSQSMQPLWARDALRRIVTQSDVSEDDIAELAELCKKPQGLSSTPLEPKPLESTHLPVGQEDGAVSLISLTHVSDVNALAPNESITFSETGLTVVYGDNGAGKSGYARILKRACRARGSGEPVLANALSDQPAGTPTAKIAVTVGGVQHEPVWKDGTPSPSYLTAVSVFDSSAAQVYVSDRTEVRFRPFGLDVLDKLGGVCTRVRARIEAERDLLQTREVVWPELPKGTQAAALLSGLTALTSHDQVDRLATLTAEDTRELEVLTDVVATLKLEDPVRKASDLRLKATRLRRLAAEVGGLAEALSGEAMDRLARIREEATAASALAAKAAGLLSTKAVLPGIDSPTWRQMWDAARGYSEQVAYPGKNFPHVADGARCVLCHQEMDAATRDRMVGFEEFIRGQVQTTAATKREAAEDAVRTCLALVPGERTRDTLEDLVVSAPFLSEAVVRFLAAAKSCHQEIASGTPRPTPLAVSPPLDDLEKAAAGLESRAQEMAKAIDPVGRKRSEDRLAELQARATLATLRSHIHAEIDRRARLNAYEHCLKDTDTRALTKFSTELTKKYVTDALTTTFDDELTRLGFTALELQLRPVGGQKGVLYHQVQLKHATRAQLPKVVSEGESRCIALAAFLAEVHGATNNSAIVFDDPVSSLDHRWRMNVARRLVEEAKTRQVIVFTHELVFLSALLREAEALDVPYLAQMVRRGGDLLAGHVDQDLPWSGLPTKKRIGVLRDRWQGLAKVHREQGEKEYAPLANMLYGDVRKTWERAIEEVLLDEVVLRFRETIETQRLRKIGDITQNDLDTIEAGMSKASKWEGGHDHALATNEPMPPPNELNADIDALDEWVKSVRKRRQ